MEASVAPERLAEVTALSDLSVSELDQIAQASRLVRAPTGTVLIEEDDASSTFVVVLSGTVTVHRSGRHINDLGPGDVVGEAGTMNLTPRNATVIATTPVEAAVVMGWDLRRLLNEMPRLKASLEAVNADRTRTA